jgi:hypothetical protein
MMTGEGFGVWSQVLHVDDGLLDAGFVDGFLCEGESDEHGGEGDVLDDARDAAAVLKDCGDGLGGEGVRFCASSFHVTVEEDGDFGLVERSEAKSGGDALREGVVAWLGEAIAQEGLADEDEGEGTFSIEVVGGQEAEILEGVVGEEVGFVDEEDGAFWESAEVSEEKRCGFAFEAAGFEAGGGADGCEESEGADGGQREREEVVVGRVEGASEEGEGGRFTAAAFGDEECDRVTGEGESEA